MAKGSRQKDSEISSLLSCFLCGTLSPIPVNNIKSEMRVDVVKNPAAMPILHPVKRRIDTEVKSYRGPCQDITNVTAEFCSPPKRAKNAPMTVTSKEMAAFFRLFGEIFSYYCKFF